MQIDAQTAADLDLVGPDLNRRHILGFLDHTWSRGGREKLRQLLLAPLSSPGLIRNRQLALQHIGASLAGFDPTDLGSTVESVERYVQSSVVELPPSAMGCLFVRLHYPGMVEEIVAGLEALVRLLSLAEELSRRLADDQVRIEIDALRVRFDGCLERQALRAIRRVRRGSFRQLRLARLDGTVRRGSADVVRSLLDALYLLDALQSLARASTTPGFSYPEIVESQYPVFSAHQAFHPLLRAPRPCDIDLHRDARVVFLTGPNMAGKTTYLKTCGVIAVLAHLGMAVPAARARISTFDTLFALLSIHDSLDRGESSFLAEVRRVGDLVGRLAQGERVLALADEMFKGTNVLDAHSATEFTVSRFARCAKSLFLVSSHLVELVDQLSRVEAIEFWHFDAHVEDDRLVFSFQLKPGASSQRLGMKLLEREGVAGLLGSLEEAQAV